MTDIVQVTIETIFDKDSQDENSMLFYTEGERKQHKDSYVYAFDESKLFQSSEPILGQLEVGQDFITRSITGEESYVMHFREGYKERIIYQTPDGSFVTDIETIKLDIDMQDGAGTAKIFYRISFAQAESMLNEVRITVKEIE